MHHKDHEKLQHQHTSKTTHETQLDKIQPDNKCKATYVYHAGRQFNTQKYEEKKECEKETTGQQTRAIKEKVTHWEKASQKIMEAVMSQ